MCIIVYCSWPMDEQNDTLAVLSVYHVHNMIRPNKKKNVYNMQGKFYPLGQYAKSAYSIYR